MAVSRSGQPPLLAAAFPHLSGAPEAVLSFLGSRRLECEAGCLLKWRHLLVVLKPGSPSELSGEFITNLDSQEPTQ